MVRAQDVFETVSNPRTDPEAYQRDLMALAVKHNVDVFVPVSAPVSSVYDAKFGEEFAKMRREKGKSVATPALCLSEKLCAIFDDKHTFSEFCETNGLPGILKSFCVRSDAEVLALNEKLLSAEKAEGQKYILKNLAYDPIHRLDLFQLPCRDVEKLRAYLGKVTADGNAITAKEPWQVQAFVDVKASDAQEYSAALLIKDGQLRMLTVCESSASQLNYDHVSVPEVESWVKMFAKKCFSASDSGLICLDFICCMNKDLGVREAHPLECNPRVHSQCSVFSSYDMQRKLGMAALFGGKAADDGSAEGVLVPADKQEPLFFFANELLKAVPDAVQFGLGLRYGPKDPKSESFLQILLKQKEADFDTRDPLPFLFRNHFQLPLLLLSTLFSAREWKKCDFCIGKVVEVGGD